MNNEMTDPSREHHDANEDCTICEGTGGMEVAASDCAGSEMIPCWRCFPEEYRPNQLAFYEQQDKAFAERG